MQVIDQLVLDENNIVFHSMIGNSYQTSEVGMDILRLLQEHKSKDEIIEELMNTYEISYNELFIDVSDFLSKLRIYGLAS